MSIPRRRRPSHPAIVGAVIAAVATVVAAAIPVVLELTRDPGGSGAASPVQGTPSAGQPQPTTPAATTGTGPSPTPAATASQPAQADVLPLVEVPQVDDLEGWEQEPLIVAGKRHDSVLSASPCWLNDHFTVTFVVSRQFRVLEAAVGIADDSPGGGALRFTVLSDRKEVFTTTAGLGKVRPVKVDISAATQVSLRVSTTNLDQCHGDSIGAWIAPRVRR
ncbi:NPCBM/NEW2 domain-containing protein [Micromonospora sp. NPDC023644]|uniref:NPCBM/NEW2 domain-containing protein n=1 Tax=Micromonospora sp. NPDC023644 TaxID=3154321 RepID=UPI0033D9BCEA